jgi:pimeloyl-ACP methyl ester carboxylesterase
LVPELVLPDVTLHLEVDGEGDPVIVVAHGITNSCRELAMLTPFVPGTKVRFCFRGHGHSSSPLHGYRFADFARDLRAVADAYGARMAVGTSLGAGVIGTIVQDEPDRFDRIVLLLPATLDAVDPASQTRAAVLRTVELVESSSSKEEAIERIMSEPARMANYAKAPWQRDVDYQWLSQINMEGTPRAIRELLDDTPLRDRRDLKRVLAPTLIIARRGDPIHPADVAETIADLMPNAELLMFDDGEDLYVAIPRIMARVSEFVLS